MLKLISRSSILAVLVAGCGTDTASDPDPGVTAAVTYHQDVKPILDAKCAGCHVEGGIAPFALTDYASAAEYAQAAAGAVTSGAMPPWQPDAGCRDYAGDRSLTPAQIETFQRWVAAATPEGDPARPGAPLTDPIPSLSRVDVTLAMAQPYTPAPTGGGSDDYRCFVIPWPATYTQTTYVTGLSARPGNDLVVHHIIAFLAGPTTVAELQAMDAAEPGPGYTCFGGAGGRVQGMLGGWVPGSLGEDLPPGIGLPVEAGSAIILQVHYNTDHAHGSQAITSDLSSVELKIDSAVERPGRVMPFTNPSWLQGNNMLIPANDPDVAHAFAFDPTLLAGGDLEVFSAALHMHTLGTSGTLRLDRKDGSKSCLLDIKDWDFHWQGSYGFTRSEVVRRGDKLAIECHWDNSLANQPIIDGAARSPADVTWGESTHDEMCLGFFLTAPAK